VQETTALLDQLGIEKAVWWGHSDGAVIGALAAIIAPQPVDAVFEQMAYEPESFGPRLEAVSCQDRGDRWRDVLRLDGPAPRVS
jgi:pimeloyl-ACP methyl ester carboxylesterase